jgi:hypothetical protein
MPLRVYHSILNTFCNLLFLRELNLIDIMSTFFLVIQVGWLTSIFLELSSSFCFFWAFVIQ